MWFSLAARRVAVIAFIILTTASALAEQSSTHYTKSELDSFLKDFLETTASDTESCKDTEYLMTTMYDKKNGLDMYSKLAFYSSRCLMNVRRETDDPDREKIPLIQLYIACQHLRPHLVDDDYKVEKKSCTALYFAPGTHLDDPFFAP